MFVKSEVIHKRFARLVQIHHGRAESRCEARLLGFLGMSFCSLSEFSGSSARVYVHPTDAQGTGQLGSPGLFVDNMCQTRETQSLIPVE